MESRHIDILDPKALHLLRNMMKQKLILIREENVSGKKQKVTTKTAERSAGERRREALEKLAEMGGITSIPDPVAWQRELRKDRKIR